ncbi:superinfection immunity protein [Devosia submarina]|uniref:superinfection immunity protein n=1 Tax=Devosia submarina TaxID=1173082 RepID=UPI001474C045
MGYGLLIALYFLPAIIAFRRSHTYKWVIFALTLAGGWTGLCWVAALVWAVFPSDKSWADPLAGNPTGLGRRNAGDTWGAVQVGISRGAASERREPQLFPDHESRVKGSDNVVDALERLQELRARGVLTEEEFVAQKSRILRT